MTRLLSLLLYLYPPAFRRAHGREIRQFLRAAPRGGLTASALALDFARSLTREWLESAAERLARTRRATTGTIHRGASMYDLAGDIRHAARHLASTPGLAAAAVLTLALGIGANTAIFSLADATLLRPVQVAAPDRLAAFAWSSSYPDYQAYASRSEAFTGLMAWSGGRVNVVVDGAAELASAAFVSGNAFGVLGVPPALGRTLDARDEVINGRLVAVLSHDYWRTRFGSDAGVIGRIVQVNNRPVTIVGVAAKGFRGASLSANPKLYLPLTAVSQTSTGFLARVPVFESSGFVWLTVIGRLGHGITIEQASSWVNGFYRQLHPPRPGDRPDPLPLLTPLRTRALGGGQADSIRRFVGLLVGIVGVTLLIGCANLANLLLARAAARRREVAVRLAMGASRRRVIGQMLTESLLLSAAGGAAGVLVALLLLRLLAGYQLPGGVDIETLALQINGATLATTAALSLLTGLVFGIAPAWRASRTNVLDALRDDHRAASARSGLRGGLVAAQVALSLVLLTGTGLFLRSLVHVLDVPRGFTVDGVATASVNLGLARYDEPRAIAFYAAALDRVRQLPQVTAAAWSHLVPVKGLMMWDAEIEGYARRPDEDVTLYASHVGPEYFRAAGTRIVAGRAFSAQDTAAAPRVAIVNEALAERYFGGRSAIGGRIKPFRGDWLTVVGVAGNTTVRRLGERPLPCIYLAFDQTLAGQNSNALDAAHLFVRTSGDVEALLPLLRDRLRSLDPALPLFDVQPFARHVRELVMPQRMGVTLFALFSTLALALALIGIYGVASYVAALRTREIGIRIALGAGARDIGRLVLTQGLAPLAIGLVAGALLAVWAARFASAFLYDVDPSDPLTLAATTGVLAAAGLAAVSVPARRAARLDPVTALRRD